MISLEPVVILVDNRKRDLDIATLIAFQLRRRGVECHLAPLEAFRAVLAYRPGMIVFNHLFASHLVSWSQRLNDMGILTGVLTNEGLLSGAGLEFQSGRYHQAGHVDYFFCWNRRHRQSVLATSAYPNATVEVVGVPRFDFYFEPWSNVIALPKPSRRQILICTNTGLAKFWELPREHGERHFAGWASHIKDFGDYWKMVESQWKARGRFLEFTRAIAESDKFDVVLRPHPSEPAEYYQDWIASLPSRSNLRIDADTNISGLILQSDLIVSDESCTTGLESWIARKPTIGIEFDRDSSLFKPERAFGHISCRHPSDILALIGAALANPDQSELRQQREETLREWCAWPDGKSSERIADLVAGAIKSKKRVNWSMLSFHDHWRAAKVRFYESFGLPYHFDPLLWFKRRLFGKRYVMKDFAYRKSIKPSDVRLARRRFESALLKGERTRDAAPL